MGMEQRDGGMEQRDEAIQAAHTRCVVDVALISATTRSQHLVKSAAANSRRCRFRPASIMKARMAEWARRRRALWTILCASMVTWARKEG